MRKTMLFATIGFAVLLLSNTAAAATRPAGFYWTTARATAAFKVAAQRQQAALLNGHPVTATCKGMTRDPESASPDPDILKVKGVTRYRFFNCVAATPCFAAPWRSRIQIVSARLPNAKLDPLRIKLVVIGMAPAGVAC